MIRGLVFAAILALGATQHGDTIAAKKLREECRARPTKTEVQCYRRCPGDPVGECIRRVRKAKGVQKW